MTVAQVAEAIEVLNRAGNALRSGEMSITGQMHLGAKCYLAAAALEKALAKIQVPVTP